tara:strand:+ start:528 stop:1304 length:777 start_codon:yes stop_codon:yes gene_type:complete
MDPAEAEFEHIVASLARCVHSNSAIGKIMKSDITGRPFMLTFWNKGSKVERVEYVERIKKHLAEVCPEGKKEDDVIKWEHSTSFEVIGHGARRMRLIAGWEPTFANASLDIRFGNSGLRCHGNDFKNLMNGGFGEGGICPMGLPCANSICCVVDLHKGTLNSEEVRGRLLDLIDESWGFEKEERNDFENQIGTYESEGKLHLNLPYLLLEELIEALENKNELFVVSAVYWTHSSQVSEVIRLVTSIIPTASLNKSKLL